jgi:predicted nucleic acid-binding protein
LIRQLLTKFGDGRHGLPDWIDVRVAVVKDDDMTHLDPGERAAIALALLEPGALLLIDESAGRIEASRRGVTATVFCRNRPKEF